MNIRKFLNLIIVMNIYKKLPLGLLVAFLFSASSIAVQGQETPEPILNLIDTIDIILSDEDTFGTEYQSNWIRVQEMLIDGKYKAAGGMLQGMENRFAAQRSKALKEGDIETAVYYGRHGILSANIGLLLERYLDS